MSQRVDYVRQNIEKFTNNKRTVLNEKTDKTPTRNHLISQEKLNDENKKPINSALSTKYSSTKKIPSRPVNSGLKLVNQISETNNTTSPTLNRRKLQANLANKINSTKGPLTTKNQQTNDKKLNTDRRLSNERRLSNDKVIKNSIINEKQTKERLSGKLSTNERSTKPTIDKQEIKKRLSNERRMSNEKTNNKTIVIADKIVKDKQSALKTNDKNPIKSTVSLSNDKLNHAINQVKQSVSDKPTKSQAINLNEDPQKHRLAIEYDLLKLKYLNVQCEGKIRKQSQAVIEIVKSIYNLIEVKRNDCIGLEQQLALKETLWFLLKMSEESLTMLENADLNKLQIYLSVVSNIIVTAQSTARVIDLNNAINMNDILEMTTSKLTADIKMDTIQEFSDKIKHFDIVNGQIVKTMEHIRSLKTTLIDEIDKRAKLKNIY